MALVNLFRKFWLQSKLEEVTYQVNLALTDLTDYDYSTKQTRIYTIKIYNNDGTSPAEIIEDDGAGNLVANATGILSTVTGAVNTLDYVNSTITITWNPTYLANLTNNPILEFKAISDTKEEHVEMLDFLGEVFDYYKQNELDDRLKYYDSDQIPLHLIDTLAKDHNWVIDRTFSEDEAYLRRQLKYLFDLYKSKRTLDSVNFAISVINKRVNIYNLIAKKGEYDDFTEYVLFDMKTLLDTFSNASLGTDQDTVASQIQAVFDSLYADSSDYYPTKHFLLDLALDIMNNNGTLLNEIDLTTLKNYILRIKSKTQYPHLQSYLGLLADATLIQQQSIPFLFKLTTAEQTFSVSDYRTLYTGPNQVESMAQLADGAWAIIPLIMNTGYTMNSGLIMNMGLGDVENYLTYFKVGKDSHTNLTDTLGGMKDPFFTSSNMTIIYDTDYYYLTLILDEAEGNDYPIKEVGIFNDQDKLAFYIKHPSIHKTSTHKNKYRLKLLVSGLLP